VSTRRALCARLSALLVLCPTLPASAHAASYGARREQRPRAAPSRQRATPAGIRADLVDAQATQALNCNLTGGAQRHRGTLDAVAASRSSAPRFYQRVIPKTSSAVLAGVSTVLMKWRHVSRVFPIGNARSLANGVYATPSARWWIYGNECVV
jgi:hypothetical protein